MLARSGSQVAKGPRTLPPVKTLLARAHVVTMDDAGTEHSDGWVLVARGFVETVGAGPPPQADRTVDLAGAGSSRRAS